MGTRPPRAAGGGILFREVNDRIYEIAAQLADHGLRTKVEFVCECAAPGCCRQISMTLGEYATLRESGGHYAVAPEHERQELICTRSRQPTYVVVEQDGAARD